VKVVVLGPGLMGSQIGVEYALGGHDVTFLARRLDKGRERVAAALETARQYDLAGDETLAGADERIGITTDVGAADGADLIVESVVEDLAEKAAALAPVMARAPRAIVATNTSAIPITAIGNAIGAPRRTVGVHYWNPPLLMPLVEVIRGAETSESVVQTMVTTLSALGKRPVRAERDVDGFIWNRLQLALLREAVWIVENGVATPETVDEIVRDGLARRWRYTGPFQTAALGGAETFQRIAGNLWPALSCATGVENLRQWLDETPETTRPLRERRDAGLAAELRADRQGANGAGT
jgi:3-hydroxybutyryl-CoA dehydrogenase